MTLRADTPSYIPTWVVIATEMLRDGRSIQNAIDLRRAVIGTQPKRAQKLRYRDALRLLEGADVCVRRNSLIAVDLPALAEMVESRSLVPGDPGGRVAADNE